MRLFAARLFEFLQDPPKLLEGNAGPIDSFDYFTLKEYEQDLLGLMKRKIEAMTPMYSKETLEKFEKIQEVLDDRKDYLLKSKEYFRLWNAKMKKLSTSSGEGAGVSPRKSDALRGETDSKQRSSYKEAAELAKTRIVSLGAIAEDSEELEE